MPGGVKETFYFSVFRARRLDSRPSRFATRPTQAPRQTADLCQSRAPELLPLPSTGRARTCPLYLPPFCLSSHSATREAKSRIAESNSLLFLASCSRNAACSSSSLLRGLRALKDASAMSARIRSRSARRCSRSARRYCEATPAMKHATSSTIRKSERKDHRVAPRRAVSFIVAVVDASVLVAVSVDPPLDSF